MGVSITQIFVIFALLLIAISCFAFYYFGQTVGIAMSTFALVCFGVSLYLLKRLNQAWNNLPARFGQE